MSLFLNLYLGHLLGDYVFQPGRLVQAKREGASGLLLHTCIVGLATCAVFVSTLRFDWAAVALVAGMHLVIERLTILTYVRTPTRGLFTLLFDQTLHLLSIALVVWIAGDWTFDSSVVTFGFRLGTPVLAAIDGLLTVALFGSILVFETGNALLKGDGGKGRLLRFDMSRIAGMVERGGALSLAMLWTPLAGLLAFVPRIVWAATRARDDRARPILEAATGAALCVIVYIAIAIIASLAGPAVTPAWLATTLPW